MSRCRNTKPGLSLVELLIVLSVLAILAALVIPRLGNASETARSTSAKTQLQTLRQQLELWRVDHGGHYPTLQQIQIGEHDWLIFMRQTDSAGSITAAGDRGPYIGSAPINPYTNSTLVVPPHATTAGAGWVYDQRDGTLKMVLPLPLDARAIELGPSDYER